MHSLLAPGVDRVHLFRTEGSVWTAISELSAVLELLDRHQVDDIHSASSDGPDRNGSRSPADRSSADVVGQRTTCRSCLVDDAMLEAGLCRACFSRYAGQDMPVDQLPHWQGRVTCGLCHCPYLQWLCITTILWLAWWVNGLKKEDKLFPGGRYSLLKLFNSVLTTLHLSGMGFTLASFRTSGATFLSRPHGNLGKLQYHGRWCSLNSLQHYLQEAMSALLASQVPEQAKAILTALNNSTAGGMSPPACAPNHQLRHGRSDSTARGPDPCSAWPTVSSRQRRRPRKER
jgi:hypothetical protein